jgi:AcrR family transcriptional regulator
MTTAYRRKKEPEQVRRALLDCAERIAVKEGLAGVTVQAVANAAGVTKGGLFHHFPSKQALLEGVFADMLTALDSEIEAHMAKDPNAYGRFTRAYVAVLLSDHGLGSHSPRAALMVAMTGEKSLNDLWYDWMASRLARHRETDDDPMLEIVRFAADGAWSAYVGPETVPDLTPLRDRLFGLTMGKYRIVDTP